MLLAIDVGNTNTVFAVYQGDNVVAEWRLMTDGRRTSDEYAATMFQLMAHMDINSCDITAAIASFVVPRAVHAIRTFVRDYFNVELMVVGDKNVKTGVKILIDQPSELGADLIVNTAAAWKRHGKPMIVVDFGTATTFHVIDHTGAFVGGCICPGINLSIEALHMAAAALPTVEVADPGRVIATSTVTAIQAGIYYGYVGMIEGIINRMKAEYGEKMLVIATGGLAPLFEKSTPLINRVEHDLTMFGLLVIYKMNH